MAEKTQILRVKPGFLPLINGVKFEPHPRGSISEPIANDVAGVFLSSPGYVLMEEEEKPTKEQAKKASDKSASDKAKKAEKEVASKSAEPQAGESPEGDTSVF